MAFWSCFYHIVWTTYRRTPTILPQYEGFIANKIKQKSYEIKCHVHAINMMPDHVHVAVSIRPAISISKWVQQAKGGSSYDLKREYELDDPFRWQKNYGIMTFGQKNLAFVVSYIENQKQHHANDEIYAFLETTNDIDEP